MPQPGMVRNVLVDRMIRLMTCLGVAAAMLAASAARAQPAGEGAAPGEMDARTLIAGAIELTRGRTSYSELEMVIRRPDWQRSSRLVAWTRGREDALIRFTAPPRDAGNAILKQGDDMWTFTPELNRVIRLPASMMSQSWAGSDFSYNDLSRSDRLLEDYTLAIVDTREQDGHRIYTVEAVPHDRAPVVWGKEVLVLRDDYVLLEQTYYDQELVPLRQLEALEIGEMGGRVFATRMRMTQLDENGHWTELTYAEAEFGIELPDSLFTVFALKSGRSP